MNNEDAYIKIKQEVFDTLKSNSYPQAEKVWLDRANDFLKEKYEIKDNWKFEYPKYDDWQSEWEKWNGKDAPPHLKPYLGSNGIIPRNKHGKRMYDEKCLDCIDHIEDSFTCDLCGTFHVCEILHASETNNQWITDLGQHECEKTKQYLSLVLCALL